MITPDDQKKWSKDPRFSLKRADGKHCLVISAGPDGHDQLKSDDNRKTDLPGKNERIRLIKPPKGMTEDQFIKALMKYHDQYADDVDYDYWPESTTKACYNSNSYIHGLLRKTGARPPTSAVMDPDLYPGWKKLLPPEYFDPPPPVPPTNGKGGNGK